MGVRHAATEGVLVFRADGLLGLAPACLHHSLAEFADEKVGGGRAHPAPLRN